MSELITIQVSDFVIRHAAQAAANTRQSVEHILSGWLERAVTEPPVQDLSDEEVLALTTLNFSESEQERFSQLLHRHREGLLDSEGRKDLDRLMRVYERGLLRKAQALEAAVKRGLIKSLKS
jgi:hypothetical protein